MASPNNSIGFLDNLRSWMYVWNWIGASSDSKNVTPLAFDTTTTFVESGEGTSVKDEIEKSKVHWSQLTEHNNDDEEVAEVSNVEVFKSLQRHPTWGHFFCTFGDGGMYDCGELVVGEKFAEGGQGKLYHARITWKNQEMNSRDQERGRRWVLKVFRKGTFLQDLQKQWPEGMFKDYDDNVAHFKLGKSQQTKWICFIRCGTLLPDGRFAFLLVREIEDLRFRIDCKMKARTSPICGPFPMEDAIVIMYCVARGMNWLHNLDIVHRDLKASNVLCAHFNKNSDKEWYDCYISDFECSIGVVGTGFFRALEILQAIKDKVVNKRPNLFTKASDVYSYGMVCYEILTEKLPFEGHPTYDFDLVLNGQQPEVPHYVDRWVHYLLRRCWQFDPSTRPTFWKILKLLEVNSKYCKRLKWLIEERERLPLELQSNSAPKYEFES